MNHFVWKQLEAISTLEILCDESLKSLSLNGTKNKIYIWRSSLIIIYYELASWKFTRFIMLAQKGCTSNYGQNLPCIHYYNISKFIDLTDTMSKEPETFIYDVFHKTLY